jgi:hypothetical protein
MIVVLCEENDIPDMGRRSPQFAKVSLAQVEAGVNPKPSLCSCFVERDHSRGQEPTKMRFIPALERQEAETRMGPPQSLAGIRLNIQKDWYPAGSHIANS